MTTLSCVERDKNLTKRVASFIGSTIVINKAANSPPEALHNRICKIIHKLEDELI